MPRPVCSESRWQQDTAMTLRPASTSPSRRSSRSWSRKGILGLLAVVLGIPGALVATCQLRDRFSGPDLEEVSPVESAPVESAPVESAPVETASVDPAPAEPAPAELAPVESPPELPLEIDAVSLISLYNSGNEIAANDQVLGRLLRVRGAVGTVWDAGSPVVYLLGSENEVGRVFCRLDADQRSLARELTPGDVVTVIGTGAGAQFRNPQLEGCRIVSW